MASDLTNTDAVPAPVVPPAPAQSEPRPAATPHRHRFLFVYGILGGVLAAAIAGVVVYAGRSISPAPAWSSWHPHGGGLGAAKQIGDQVGASYRLPNGSQLVDVIAKAPTVPGQGGAPVPINFFAIRGSQGTADRVFAVSSSNTIMYSLCGLGTSCTIATGKPSVARGTLVRREVLELALYTFRYVGGVKSIVAFMPPKNASTTPPAILLQKSDLEAQLKTPLEQVLRAKTPLPAGIPAHEVQVIDSTTESRVYTYGISQTQQGDVVLVLKPLAA